MSTFVYACSQVQRTHSARTNLPKIVAYLSLLRWSHALRSDQKWMVKCYPGHTHYYYYLIKPSHHHHYQTVSHSQYGCYVWPLGWALTDPYTHIWANFTLFTPIWPFIGRTLPASSFLLGFKCLITGVSHERVGTKYGKPCCRNRKVRQHLGARNLNPCRSEGSTVPSSL